MILERCSGIRTQHDGRTCRLALYLHGDQCEPHVEHRNAHTEGGDARQREEDGGADVGCSLLCDNGGSVEHEPGDLGDTRHDEEEHRDEGNAKEHARAIFVAYHLCFANLKATEARQTLVRQHTPGKGRFARFSKSQEI